MAYQLKQTPVLTFISSNEGKRQELQQSLPYPVRLQQIDLEEIQTADLETLVLHKLKQAKQVVTDGILVEDTSLIFTAWGKLPGPFIKFFLQEIHLAEFHKMLQVQDHFEAKAISIIGLFHQGKTLIFRGEIDGQIVLPRGENGFGWDSIFQPQGTFKTFAEMEDEEKQDYSMRQIALDKLTCYLNHLS